VLNGPLLGPSCDTEGPFCDRRGMVQGRRAAGCQGTMGHRSIPRISRKRPRDTTRRLIAAGIEAMDHFTMNSTIAQNGILTSTTATCWSPELVAPSPRAHGSHRYCPSRQIGVSVRARPQRLQKAARGG
jgi:hypothetical protein